MRKTIRINGSNEIGRSIERSLDDDEVAHVSDELRIDLEPRGR